MKPSTGGDVAPFAISVALHAAILLFPVLAQLYGHTPSPKLETLPNSIAMVGNSIEVEAPTPEVAAAPAAPQPEPLDIAALPTEPVPTLAPAPKPRPAPVVASEPAPASEPAVTPNPARQPSVKPRPAARPASASPPAPGSDAPTSGSPAAGTFGQEGLAPGVRRLGYAFTRAIPAATPADDAWQKLPPGHVGTIRIELEVDENNHLGPLKHWQARAGELSPPAVLERMVDRTLLLLRAGQFALSGSNRPGSERLIIDVELRDDPAVEDATINVVNKGFEGATPGHPGKAHFRYGTGRTFEAKVTIVHSGN